MDDISYERKKRIEVAIDALAHYKSHGSRSEANKAVLVIAGGYDLRVDENVQYLEVGRICLFERKWLIWF